MKVRGWGMGYRDLSSFNLTMLDKQVPRVLKVKYFSNCDILDTWPNSNSNKPHPNNG